MDSEGGKVCMEVIVAGLLALAFGGETPSPDVDIMDEGREGGPSELDKVGCLVRYVSVWRKDRSEERERME